MGKIVFLQKRQLEKGDPNYTSGYSKMSEENLFMPGHNPFKGNQDVGKFFIASSTTEGMTSTFFILRV